MATRFYYPAFRKHIEHLDSFLRKHQADMVRLNNITDPELTQLNSLRSALDAIVTGPTWPKYTELG